MKLSRIPFDSFVLSAVVAEIQDYVGGKVQGIRQPNESDIVIGLYAGGSEAMLLLSCNPEFARVHFVTKRAGTLTPPPAFCSTLRARIDGARLVSASQIQGDRVLELAFEGPGGTVRLIAELMGKHSNLILVEPGGRVLSAAKWVGPSKSSRPIQSGVEYGWPPVLKGGDELKTSPFYSKLDGSMGKRPERTTAVISIGFGAYPCSVAVLGYQEFARPSISVALEQYYSQAILAHSVHALQASLVSQLSRVILARETAISDLRQAQEAGRKAGKWQRYGELILAYGAASAPNAAELVAWDYDGLEVTVKLDPDKDFRLNAASYFERAKKAKGRMGMVTDQLSRLAGELEVAQGILREVSEAERLDKLTDLLDQAKSKRWFVNQAPPVKNKEDRPYEGNRIRELSAPGGWTVLFGENAEANDFLTMRVAKPNDWWLHIRGATSAHVVVVTRNQPEKVQRETLEFAAKVAVQHSPSKHGGYIAVDYTLKKYVRKPRGSAMGMAQYTNERTLHVEGS